MEKLYYQDILLKEFTATVLSCEKQDKGWDVTLDRTAFYPEGGGQAADTGTLEGIPVLHVREEGEQVIHLLAAPLTAGQRVQGVIDYPHRFDLMQQHTGEHIVSGIINRKYGYHNVGFHMGADTITIDFDGVIPPEDLPELEQLANEAVYRNLPVKIFTPAPEELPLVRYRTKRALPWPVRIVQVPGYDSCACCGLHVQYTGQIALIKLFSCVKFRSGSRIEMLSGKRAFDYLNENYRQNLLVSRAFSAKPLETGEAARRMNEQVEALKGKIAALETEQFRAIAQSCAGKGDVLIFREGLDSVMVRRLADLVADSCGATAAVFSGSDETGYSYCLVTRCGDLRSFGKNMNQALSGRGGGKAEFQQGSVKAGKESILEHFSSFLVMLP